MSISATCTAERAPTEKTPVQRRSGRFLDANWAYKMPRRCHPEVTKTQMNNHEYTRDFKKWSLKHTLGLSWLVTKIAFCSTNKPLI